MEKRNNLSDDAGRDQLQDDETLLTGATQAEDGDENYDDEDLDDELDEEDDDELLDDDDDEDEEDEEKDVI